MPRWREIPKALDDLIVSLMAKAPGDRPWDSAAVGVKLDRAARQGRAAAPVAMVWPSQPVRGPPAQAGAGDASNGAVVASSAARRRKSAKPARH